MQNKQTGEVVEFKGVLYNDHDCIILYNDNQTLRYKNLDEFRNIWKKYDS